MGYSTQPFIDESSDQKLARREIKLNDKYHTQWIRFSAYTLKSESKSESKSDSSNINGKNSKYITPADGAEFELYNPFDVAEQLLIDTLRLGDAYAFYLSERKDVALNAYRKRKIKKLWSDLENQIIEYACHYGLMGFISTSTHNRHIVGDGDILISKKNNIGIQARVVKEEAYIKRFTPFVEKGVLETRFHRETAYLVKYEDTPKFYGKRPLVMDLIFSSFYSEQIQWILDFALMLNKHFNQLETFKKSASLTEPVTILADAFEATKIGFTVTRDKETRIAWEFDSLKTTIQTIYAFALTSDSVNLKRCEHCGGFYIASSAKEKYCGGACRNRHNVKKSRERKSENIDD